MFTVTFYSFRGGVGRTMALANVAYYLAQSGRKVFLIDFDLEAPGLSLMPEFRPTDRQGPKSPEGLIGYLRAGLSDAPLPDIGTLTFETPLSAKLRESSSRSGTIHLLPAGGCPGQPGQYDLAHLRLDRLYETLPRSYVIDALRVQIEKHFQPDYLLVDSRTGLSEAAGICTVHLADLLVVLFGLNRQNLDGTSLVVDKLRRARQDFSENVIFVASPVPGGEEPLKQERLATARASLAGSLGNRLPKELPVMVLPYHPQLALSEQCFIEQYPESPLAIAYRHLGDAVRERNRADLDYRTDCIVSRELKSDPASALRQIQEFIDAPSAPPHALVLYAMLLPLFDPSRPPERYFLRAIQANPNAGEMLGTYAVFLEQQGRCEEAERFYRRAIDAEPHHVSSLRSYALFLSRQGRSEEAEAYYQQAIQSGPERASTLQDYALFLQSQGRFADAEAIYNSAMEELLGPKHSWHRLEWEAMKARRSLNLVIVAMARAADEDQLHRLLLLAVTAGECLGFSRAILFLKRENNEVFDAVVAVGPVDLDAAMRQWSEAKGMPLAEMIERCARPPSPPRPGDLQKSIDELSLDARQPELLSKLGAGSIVVRRRGAPPLLRDLPGWPTTVNSDAEDSEYVFAPLEVSGTLYGAIYADRSFIATSVIPQYTLDLLEVLIREFALSLAALRQRREEAEAKAAKELARGISHGLATRVRILEAELALLKGELSGQHADAIARMEKSIAFFKRTSKLSAGLLGVKRLGLEKGGPCDLNEVVAEMVALLADARIEFRRSPSRLIVRADRARIEEILTELLVNARDFVDPETGRISVETGIAGRTARVEIRDNGPGIHPALRPHLFRSFSSYPTSRRGLGLSYAKTLAEGYGGTITEIGQWGQGARFVTEIPLAELPAPVLCDVIIDELEHDPALSLSESKARQLAEQLRPVLANAEVAAAQQDDIDKQVALIAAHLARGMPDNDVSRLLVGRLCARLLTQTGLQLRLSPAHVNELYELAVADDPRTPDNVLIWIRNHAKLIARGIDDAVPIRATDRR